MRKVAIASSATTAFRKSSDLSIYELACEPSVELLKATTLRREDIDAVIVSSCSVEQYTSSIISEMLGISPRVSHRIDNLCNSGTNAIAAAYSYIASGLCDTALVIGAEKADSPGSRLIWDITRGSFAFPLHWAALFAKYHMRKYGTTEEQMAMVSVRNHKSAASNPMALFRKPLSLDDVMTSRRIAEPIKLLDCSASCDGASAVLLMSEEKAKQFSETPIWIEGIGQRTSAASFSRAAQDLSSIEAARIAARDAFKMAKSQPKEIDIAEVHDAFTILEIMAYEDLGFVEKGNGGNFRAEEAGIAINTRGGLLGCGHPIGATGVSQVSEIAVQLANKAGPRQIGDCRTGLVHNLSAAGTSATVMIMRGG